MTTPLERVLSSPRKRRFGQVQQVFILLAALIVIIASVYVGLKLFSGVRATACESMDASFMQDIRDVLDANIAFGSTNEVSVRTNCDADMLCFVASSQRGNATFEVTPPTGKHAPLRAIIRTKNIGANIFQHSAKRGFIPVGLDERVTVQELVGPTLQDRGYLCIDVVGGQFTFATQGRGRTIVIKKP